MNTCAVPRCGRPARGRKPYCHRHGEYLRRTGRVPTMRDPLGRLLAKVREDAHGCWRWTGPLTRGPGRGEGYGRFRLDGRIVAAHRAAWEILVGPIPDGLTLDHLCRVRDCVRVDHLEPVQISENLRRAPDALATRNGGKVVCDAGHPFTPENTYTSPQGKRDCRACRERHRRYRAERASSTP